ncbi:hypothetical protein DMH04_30690 [Kibdelosporangium aridum]|uniref:Uncharacterized protein n=1 Tax=Kibdelosporangium aridum TaxID=2030 RepID=A0A428Z2S0_KIBAR|nr:hypothetical protein [Kibdelosporangium aridum]RSM79972.1 hypothetical protein DMH04_30690 [Kibdelosporangium aridum]
MATDHDPMDFFEREYDYDGEYQVEPNAEGDVLVRTVCPACHGRTSTQFSVGLPSGAKGPKITPARRVTVVCGCGYPHNLRPSTTAESGCGAYWKVDLA